MSREFTTSALLTSDIAAFHTKFELSYGGYPRELQPDMALFRIGFMIEELAEYATSSGFDHIARLLNEAHENIKANNRWLTRRNEGGRNLELQFDSLIDLVYVALGTSYLHGFDFDEGWRRVHGANMAKERVDVPGNSKRASSFDVIKPKGWRPADLSDLVKEQPSGIQEDGVSDHSS